MYVYLTSLYTTQTSSSLSGQLKSSMLVLSLTLVKTPYIGLSKALLKDGSCEILKWYSLTLNQVKKTPN